MTLAALGIGYGGLGVVVAALGRVRQRVGVVDALLLAVLWPLYGPFLLIGRAAEIPAPPPALPRDDDRPGGR